MNKVESGFAFLHSAKNDFPTETIPKLIFRTSSYDIDAIPHTVWDIYHNQLKDNPEYRLIHFDDFQCEYAIYKNYGTELRDLYLKLVPTAFRADFFRYLMLYSYGGVYMDFTQQSLIPLDKIINNYKEIYVRDYYSYNELTPAVALYNAFIATVPQTKLLETAIDMCIENIENEYYGNHTLDITGPALLGKAFRKLKLDGEVESETQLIKVGEINKDMFIYNFDKSKYGEYIVNEETEDLVIKNKLDAHYRILYGQKSRYPELYEKKQVYNTKKIY